LKIFPEFRQPAAQGTWNTFQQMMHTILSDVCSRSQVSLVPIPGCL